ncbi:MAG: acetyl-CoA carboxylase biotin carboxyl carrier protein [Eubacteriales bacterium]|nr:acetyl-CoA carboxylase biotin carboxyl carrier protein [Eubacteriales bacterium]
MNVADIKKLMEVMAATGTTDLEWEVEGDKIRLERKQPTFLTHGEGGADATSLMAMLNQLNAHTAAAPVGATQGASTPSAEPAELAEKPGQLVTSPVVGIFYASPSPDSDPFASVGKFVEAGAPLCIIEAMKLMNEVTSPYSGVVSEILVENGQRVEFGQPLFRIGG